MNAAKRKRLNQTVYRHDWKTLDEWVRTLDELAELDDGEIEDIVGRVANDVDGEEES